MLKKLLNFNINLFKILFPLLQIFFTLPIYSQNYIIKFASLAPEGSTWMNVMREYAQAIQKETGGKVSFKIYPGGVAGDEKDVLRKIRLGQLHSAGFTGVGMGEIAPIERILDTAYLFNNYDEIDYIYNKFTGQIEKAFEENGFVLLGWAEVGFVYVFTNVPIHTIDDMKSVKMWMWEGDPVAESAFEIIGISPIPLSVTDVMTSLQTKLIDGVYVSPLACVALQWFTKLKYMFAIPLTNASGSILISKKMFDSLPIEFQEVLVKNGKKYMNKLTQLSRQDNEKAIEILKSRGVQITNTNDPNELARYQEIGKKSRRFLIGKLYTEEFLNSVERELEDYRKGKK
jgi:TRAP-type C4-dicarboxylate transport system substrate-binding protein